MFQFIDGDLIGYIVDMGYRKCLSSRMGKVSIPELSNEKTVELYAQEALVDYIYTLGCGSVETEYHDALLKLGDVLSELHNATRRGRSLISRGKADA